jgi:hypothetical protein
MNVGRLKHVVLIVAAGLAPLPAFALADLAPAEPDTPYLAVAGTPTAIPFSGQYRSQYAEVVALHGLGRSSSWTGYRRYFRVLSNELFAIEGCLEYVRAQLEFASKHPAGATTGAFIQSLANGPALSDGGSPGPTPFEKVPLRKLVESASSDAVEFGMPSTPFNGYIFKPLFRQGHKAPGGAVDYVVDGKLRRGFALIAYPAKYGISGLSTFIINHQGMAFEKDLGPRSERIAERMRSFNPDETWRPVYDFMMSGCAEGQNVLDCVQAGIAAPRMRSNF